MQVRMAVLAIALALAAAPAPAVELSGPARVIDGDTLEIAGRRVRLDGIDAPESAQTCLTAAGREWRCGAAATQRLAWLAQVGVTCRGNTSDRYGRLIATCTGHGVSLNAAMVRAGLALAYRHYSRRYVPEEEAARADGAGLWAGSFTAPWEYRQVRRQGVVAEGPHPRCPIKGNISAAGRIYHTPHSRDYARTRIDTSRGERWFCSEAEALAAGWRAPRS